MRVQNGASITLLGRIRKPLGPFAQAFWPKASRRRLAAHISMIIGTFRTAWAIRSRVPALRAGRLTNQQRAVDCAAARRDPKNQCRSIVFAIEEHVGLLW